MRPDTFQHMKPTTDGFSKKKTKITQFLQDLTFSQLCSRKLDPEDENTIKLRNIVNYVPVDKA
jgi:hypothetical protein